jgi:putative addiction module component (TIGR02574 family)
MIVKNRLTQEVLDLPLDERVQLLDLVQQSFDIPDPARESEWLTEAKSRFRGYQAGKIKAVSLEKVLGIKRK